MRSYLEVMKDDEDFDSGVCRPEPSFVAVRTALGLSQRSASNGSLVSITSMRRRATRIRSRSTRFPGSETRLAVVDSPWDFTMLMALDVSPALYEGEADGAAFECSESLGHELRAAEEHAI